LNKKINGKTAKVFRIKNVSITLQITKKNNIKGLWPSQKYFIKRFCQTIKPTGTSKNSKENHKRKKYQYLLNMVLQNEK